MKKILIAEPNTFVREMLSSTFEKAGFKTIAVTNDIDAINRASFSKPDAILIDSFVSRNIHHTVKFMKSHPSISSSIPIMVSSNEANETFINSAKDAGATDIIEKPFIQDSIVERFTSILNSPQSETTIIQPLKRPSFSVPAKKSKPTVVAAPSKRLQQTQYMLKLIRQMYEREEGPSLSHITEAERAVQKFTKFVYEGNELPIINRNKEKDDSNYLHVHTVNRLFYSLMGAFELGWTQKETEHLGLAAMLTDIGYIRINRDILKKKEKLTLEERQEMQRHVEEGAIILSALELSEEVIEAVAFHHERFDGNGYPYRLSGNQINKSAKLLAIVDTFDALTSWRKHRPELSSQEAVRKMRSMKGAFDPELLHAFISTGLCKEHARGRGMGKIA